MLNNEIGRNRQQRDRDKCDGEARGDARSHERIFKQPQPWSLLRPPGSSGAREALQRLD